MHNLAGGEVTAAASNRITWNSEHACQVTFPSTDWGKLFRERLANSSVTDVSAREYWPKLIISVYC
jgi:hypothetical protein